MVTMVTNDLSSYINSILLLFSPFLIVSVSIPNLQVRISQYHVAVAHSFVGQTTKCLSPLVCREVSPENSGPEEDVGKECGSAVRDRTVTFQDDLRNGTLEFMDQSQRGGSLCYHYTHVHVL